MIRGSVATFGYADKRLNVAQELEWAMRVNPAALLIDTRLHPFCSWAQHWCRPALERTYGKRYRWRGDWLGNLNHARPEQGIQLANEERGLPWLVHELEKGHTLILLCACQNYTACHRKVIYDKVKASLGACLSAYSLGQRVMTPCGAGMIDPAIPLEVHRARNRYAVILDQWHPQRHFFPHELVSDFSEVAQSDQCMQHSMQEGA